MTILRHYDRVYFTVRETIDFPFCLSSSILGRFSNPKNKVLMPRKPRIEIVGYYHIINSGLEQKVIFEVKEDYENLDA